MISKEDKNDTDNSSGVTLLVSAVNYLAETVAAFYTKRHLQLMAYRAVFKEYRIEYKSQSHV